MFFLRLNVLGTVNNKEYINHLSMSTNKIYSSFALTVNNRDVVGREKNVYQYSNQ